MAHQPAVALEQFGRTRIYLLALADEWLLFIYVAWGLRRSVTTFRQLIDHSPWTVGRWGIYAAIAAGAALAWMACGVLFGWLLHPAAGEIHRLQTLLPRGGMEKALWAVISVSSGFCEEFVYRGYLQQQFQRWTGSLAVAIALQAVVYGLAHAALPWDVAASVTCLGLFLGALAAWRRSLAPGMLQHAGFRYSCWSFVPPMNTVLAADSADL